MLIITSPAKNKKVKKGCGGALPLADQLLNQQSMSGWDSW